MSVTSINGQLVHYEAYGRGKPVIFVHGWLGSWRYWWPTMQALANQYRSFAVDLWGFGDSSKDSGEYSLESYVALLDGFINKMGIAGPVVLVGHSLGAMVTLRYSRQSPEQVDRIATVAMPLSASHINGYLAGKSGESVIEQSKSSFSAFPEVVMGLEKVDVSAIEQFTAHTDSFVLADDLLKVTCPILLIFGARDTLIKHPSGEMEDGDAESSNRKCLLLDECSHFPMLEQPAVFNRLLREFIDNPVPLNLEPKSYWQRRTR
ncbi:MAG: alpha/beta hydrolase [Chloroflexota bacterium]|jgi:pimeloyl-ACP methyl ester carboxylesterase